MKEVKTSKAQSAKGLLSQGIVVNDLVFTAGFIHIDPQGQLETGTVEQKLARIMNNIKEVLIAADSNLDKVVKATIYVTAMGTLAELNKHWANYFGEILPVREAVCVKELPLQAEIEISVVAVRSVL